jgi:hypothetical protein
MPAVSKSQQRLMGWVHAAQKGEAKHAPHKIKSIAKSIDPTDAGHFASTKHDDLPEKAATSPGVPARLLRSYVPIGDRRESLTPDEQGQIDDGQSQWMPKMIQTDATPISQLMASPGKHGLLKALLMGGLGGAAGFGVGKGLGTSPGLAAGIGAGAGALYGGLTGYVNQHHENDDLAERMRRMPAGSTKRDLDNEGMISDALTSRYKDAADVALIKRAAVRVIARRVAEKRAVDWNAISGWLKDRAGQARAVDWNAISGWLKDRAGQAGQLAKDTWANPHGRSAVIGAGIGGGLGMASGLLDGDEEQGGLRKGLSRGLMLGGAGAGVGYAGSHMGAMTDKLDKLQADGVPVHFPKLGSFGGPPLGFKLAAAANCGVCGGPKRGAWCPACRTFSKKADLDGMIHDDPAANTPRHSPISEAESKSAFEISPFAAGFFDRCFDAGMDVEEAAEAVIKLAAVMNDEAVDELLDGLEKLSAGLSLSPEIKNLGNEGRELGGEAREFGAEAGGVGRGMANAADAAKVELAPPKPIAAPHPVAPAAPAMEAPRPAPTAPVTPEAAPRPAPAAPAAAPTQAPPVTAPAAPSLASRAAQNAKAVGRYASPVIQTGAGVITGSMAGGDMVGDSDWQNPSDINAAPNHMPGMSWLWGNPAAGHQHPWVSRIAGGIMGGLFANPWTRKIFTGEGSADRNVFQAAMGNPLSRAVVGAGSADIVGRIADHYAPELTNGQGKTWGARIGPGLSLASVLGRDAGRGQPESGLLHDAASGLSTANPLMGITEYAGMAGQAPGIKNIPYVGQALRDAGGVGQDGAGLTRNIARGVGLGTLALAPAYHYGLRWREQAGAGHSLDQGDADNHMQGYDTNQWLNQAIHGDKDQQFGTLQQFANNPTMGIDGRPWSTDNVQHRYDLHGQDPAAALQSMQATNTTAHNINDVVGGIIHKVPELAPMRSSIAPIVAGMSQPSAAGGQQPGGNPLMDLLKNPQKMQETIQKLMQMAAHPMEYINSQMQTPEGKQMISDMAYAHLGKRPEELKQMLSMSGGGMAGAGILAKLSTGADSLLGALGLNVQNMSWPQKLVTILGGLGLVGGLFAGAMGSPGLGGVMGLAGAAGLGLGVAPQFNKSWDVWHGNNPLQSLGLARHPQQ